MLVWVLIIYVLLVKTAVYIAQHWTISLPLTLFFWPSFCDKCSYYSLKFINEMLFYPENLITAAASRFLARGWLQSPRSRRHEVRNKAHHLNAHNQPEWPYNDVAMLTSFKFHAASILPMLSVSRHSSILFYLVNVSLSFHDKSL